MVPAAKNVAAAHGCLGRDVLIVGREENVGLSRLAHPAPVDVSLDSERVLRRQVPIDARAGAAAVPGIRCGIA